MLDAPALLSSLSFSLAHSFALQVCFAAADIVENQPFGPSTGLSAQLTDDTHGLMRGFRVLLLPLPLLWVSVSVSIAVSV